jgi:hypothetical protein
MAAAARSYIKHTPSVHDLLFDVDQLPIEAAIRGRPLSGAGHFSPSRTLQRITLDSVFIIRDKA